MKSMFTLPNFALGFDEILTQFNNFEVSSFPPYNMYKIDDNKFTIELAVAGYSEKQLEVSLEDKQLLIKGTKENKIDDLTKITIFKGMTSGAFTRSFVLYDDIELKDVELSNGILTISLEKNTKDKVSAKFPIKVKGN